MRALDRGHRVTVAPFQKPGVLEEHGLSLAQGEAAAWAVVPGSPGKHSRGAGAVNLALAVALGTSLPMRFYTLPVIRQIQDAVYAWVARTRNRLPGDTPYCEQFPAECR